MSKSTYGARRAGLASLATLSLVTVAAVAGAGAASAQPGFSFQRLGGTDRYETSTLVADEYAETNKDVILANGEPGNYADALSANTLAGEMKSPVLLTRTDKTPDSVLTQLKEDGVQNITVVGGETVISNAQVAALRDAGYSVTRVSGGDRFATNAEIIRDSGNAVAGTGLIATGFNFPDALAAGPISYQGHPLGLSTQNNIDDEVVGALKNAGVTKVLIFGGESAVSSAVVAKLAANGITVAARFDGTDRSETSELAAEYALKNLSFDNTHLGVASGYVDGYGADALAGGPLEGQEKAPMLVTRDVNNPDDVLDFVTKHADTLKDGHLYGGPAAISTAVQDALEKAAQGDTSGNQDLAVSPTDKVTLTALNGASEGTGDDRQYTVSGLTAGTTYTIALLPAANVKVAADNTVSFADSANTNGQADGIGDAATPAAHISVVNGTANADDMVSSSPVNGQITFTVDGDGDGNVIPVVFQDADKDGALDVAPAGDFGAPSEAFGIGGEINYNPSEAPSGVLGDGTGSDSDQQILEVDETANNFVTAASFYEYDANDLFYVNDDAAADNAFQPAEQVTMEEFEAALSTGDILSEGTIYQANSALQSTFLIDDVDPAAPTGNSASGTTDTSTVLTLTGVDADATKVTVYGETDPSEAPAPEVDSVVTTDSDVYATATADADANTPGFQVKVTGLTPSTNYDFAATQTVDGEESGLSPEAEVTTNGPDVTGPVVTGVGPNDVNNGVGSTNQVRITFNEAVTSLNAAGVTITSGSFTFDGVSATAGNASGSVWVVTLDGTMQDALAGNEATYVLDLAAGAATDTAGNKNLEDADGANGATNDGSFQY